MVAFVSDDVTRVLVQRTIVGDRVALATLFEHCHLRVFRSAFLVVRNREVADDIVQLVFLELFRALPSFDTHRPFLPWLYRIVHHVTVDYLRREVYRRPTLPLRETTPDPTDVAERIEESALLGPVLDALSMEHREALMLRYFVGLSEREMATVLQIRPGTVKSRLYRALNAARAVLEVGTIPTPGSEGAFNVDGPGYQEGATDAQQLSHPTYPPGREDHAHAAHA